MQFHLALALNFSNWTAFNAPVEGVRRNSSRPLKGELTAASKAELLQWTEVECF